MISRGFWNIDDWPRPDEWSAWWAFCGFLVTTGVAVFALLQLRAYLQERESQARPYVVVDYVFHSVLMRVEVKNVSGALATNVRLSVDRPFQASRVDWAEIVNSKMQPPYVIRQLAPHRAIQWTLDRAPDYFNDVDLPRTYLVTATYEDPRAMKRRAPWRAPLPAEYTDTFELSIDQWNEAVAETDYENKNWNALHRIDGHLNRIANKR